MDIVIIVLILAGIAFLLFKRLMQFEVLNLDNKTRELLPGKFIRLSEGETHYEIMGKTDAPVVVLIHGFSTPLFTWDLTFPALIDAGYRVLRYDLFGRGFSDRPLKDYDLQLCVSQLRELLVALEISIPVNLVGLSYGGPVAASFTNQYPKSVQSLILMDPLVTTTVLKKRILNVPLIGELLMDLYLCPFILPKSQSGDFFQPNLFPDWESQFKQQMRFKGFSRAILSAFRSIKYMTPESDYRVIGNMPLPVLGFRGNHDQTISREDMRLLEKLIPQIKIHLIENAGHIPHYERHDCVNQILIDFLSTH